MQQAFYAKQPQRIWALVHRFTPASRRQLQLKGPDGKPLSKQQQEEAVVNHAEQLLNGGGTVSPAVLAEVACEPNRAPFPPPTAEEVQQALGQLRFGKAADALGVAAEMLRVAGPIFLAMLLAVLWRLWQPGGTMPAAVVEAEMSAVMKPKGDPACSNRYAP